MTRRQWTIDAFADQPFLGNPACVLEPFDQWPDDTWMQSIAMENNQSETAYLCRTSDPSRFNLRWFTPTVEVDLCGHATLAAAHVLFKELGALGSALTFDTRSGPLNVKRSARGYEMNLPADPPRRTAEVDGLANALGAVPVETWTGRYLVAVMDSEATVRALTPDMKGLLGLRSEAGEPGQVIVCARSDSAEYDVVDRFFGPGCGIEEDAATGSAHCILAPLYAAKLSQKAIRFFQAYPSRGARIEAEPVGDRVLIRGSAVTVFAGAICI